MPSPTSSPTRRLTRPTHHLPTTPTLRTILLLLDALLTTLIILFIPYTEIDYQTYMAQVRLYLAGTTDYTLLKGPTGPLVYPAAHVWIYRVLHALSEGGREVGRVQWVFGGVYLGALGVVMGVGGRGGAPGYVFPLLVLSKRLHSVFVLRLFNDCWAVVALWGSVWAWQESRWVLGCVVFSLGVGVKMSLLLAMPGVLVLLWLVLPRGEVLVCGAVMVGVQVLIAIPFLTTNASGYLSRAFEFTRQFLFKWTVNWRFVGEEMFLSKAFSRGLLLANLMLLALFVLTRWTRPSGLSLTQLVRRVFKPLPKSIEKQISRNVTPTFIMTTILTSMIIGMLCARSLHYQFYAYIAWATPFLLWRAGFHPVFIYAIWGAQEWAWNVYPSTNTSSKVVVGCLAIQVLGVWWGTRNDFKDVGPPPKDILEHEHDD